MTDLHRKHISRATAEQTGSEPEVAGHGAKCNCEPEVAGHAARANG